MHVVSSGAHTMSAPCSVGCGTRQERRSCVMARPAVNVCTASLVTTVLSGGPSPLSALN